MAQGRPRVTREVFATKAPSRHPVRAEHPGMQFHASSRLVVRKARGKPVPRFQRMSLKRKLNRIPTPLPIVLFRGNTPTKPKRHHSFECSTCSILHATPPSDRACMRAGIICPLLRVLPLQLGPERRHSNSATRERLHIRWRQSMCRPLAVARIDGLRAIRAHESAECSPAPRAIFRRDSSPADSCRYRVMTLRVHISPTRRGLESISLAVHGTTARITPAVPAQQPRGEQHQASTSQGNNF